MNKPHRTPAPQEHVFELWQWRATRHDDGGHVVTRACRSDITLDAGALAPAAIVLPAHPSCVIKRVCEPYSPGAYQFPLTA